MNTDNSTTLLRYAAACLAGNAVLASHGPLNDEQFKCIAETLTSSESYNDCMGMLDDLEARMSIDVTVARALIRAANIGRLSSFDVSAADYFAFTFGRPSTIDALKDFPIASSCGADCRSAIDSGFALVNHIHQAVGTNPVVENQIISAVEMAIAVYALG